MCSLCRLPVAEHRNFCQILTLGGSCTCPLLPIRVKFGVLKQTERLHLHAKFHLNVFIMSASGGQKPQFLAHFDIWGPLYRPPFTDEGQFGVLKQTEHLHLRAKFHLHVFVMSASSGQKPQLWANFEFWGLLYRPPFIYEGQIWCAIADPQRTFTCQNLSRLVYSIALAAKKNNFCCFLDFCI